jgi:hypothetical protein
MVISYQRWNNLKNMHTVNGIILILMKDCNVFRRHIQLVINEGWLKFAESHQMKLIKDPFLMNMNMVEHNGKKILVRSSQAKSTKGKEVFIGEE